MSATNSSGNATISAGSSATSDVIPKSVITICILVAGFALGVLIAKLVNYCYNRADVPDNASDISEHTKGLLRIQLALLKFGKGGSAGAEGSQDPEEAKRQQQATVLSMWKMKAMNKAAVQKEQTAAEGATGVEVVNESATRNGKVGKGGAAAAAKKGGAANKAGAKPKTFVRPKKLFPNSVAGVAPATTSAATTSAPTPTPAVAKTTAVGDLAKAGGGPPKSDQSDA